MTTPLDAELPPLPDPSRRTVAASPSVGLGIHRWAFSGQDMRDYARAAIAADRAARQPAPAAQAQQRSLPLEFDDELGVFLWNGRPTLDTLEDSQDVLGELDKARGFANGYRVMAEMLLPQPPQGGSA